jgi:hypothetical protein
MSNFTDFFPAAGGGGGGIPKYQDFTSSGTFTPTQALIDAGGRVGYFVVGGGQRGSRLYNSSDFQAGGAGGHIKIGYATLANTTGCAVTIGAGGTSNGSSGGNSSVAFNSAGGVAVTANGGSGTYSSNGGAAGSSRNKDSHSHNETAAQSGAFGYGLGGSTFVTNPEGGTGVGTPVANSGSGSVYGTNAAAGFVRITWFE